MYKAPYHSKNILTNKGQKRTTTKVIIQNIIFLDNKPK
ncbi:single stranded DNA binding protein [Candidatus Phytoplasma asteris]|uniref:Single stranded DNA binding protein n=1 Tax=Candidatus Phytoplasma asteris TaxID=85620 RepID=A0ABZ2YHN3_9MOLU